MVGGAFAELMLAAKEVSKPPEDPDAPFGYRADGVTPKRGPGGRPVRKSPGVEDLKAARAEAADQSPVSADRPPAAVKGRRRGGQPREESPAPPMPRGGVIAGGMNRAYRTAGRIAQAMSQPGSKGARAGAALAEMTRKADAEDITVGEAWEHFAAGNPRVRAVLLKLMSGGAAGELFTAHLPLALVLFMPSGDAAGPLARVAGAFLGADDDGPAPDGNGQGTGAGMSPGDVQEMMAFAQAMAQRAAGVPERGE